PCAQSMTLANTGCFAEEQEECRLESVLNVLLVVQHAPAKTENHRSMSPEKQLEGGLIALRDPAIEQGRVGQSRLTAVAQLLAEVVNECMKRTAAHDSSVPRQWDRLL